jgi:hypothetical protein
MSGGAMAQTTLTAGNAKVVPGYTGDLTLSLTVPSEIAAWQAVISLPEGVTLTPEDGTLEIKKSETESSTADAKLFKSVKLLNHTKGHVVMGGIAEKDGDGIAKGDLLLVCFPTTSDMTISDASKGLCTITLQAAESYTGPKASDKEIANNITVKSFQACDAEGNPDTSGKFKADAVSAIVYQLRGDVNNNGKVNVNDVVAVCKEIKAKTNQPQFDVNGNGSVNVNDVVAVCKEIKLK